MAESRRHDGPPSPFRAARLRVAPHDGQPAGRGARLQRHDRALTGPLIFRFFSISVHSLRIVGGVLFFTIGYEMLQARLTRTKHNEGSVHEYVEDIAITPLGVPMICGPRVITTAVLLMNESAGWARRLVLFVAMGVVSLLTYLFRVSGRRVIAALGPSGNKVVTRLMGLIVMVIAVEFFFAGLGPIVRGMVAPVAAPPPAP